MRELYQIALNVSRTILKYFRHVENVSRRKVFFDITKFRLSAQIWAVLKSQIPNSIFIVLKTIVVITTIREQCYSFALVSL